MHTYKLTLWIIALSLLIYVCKYGLLIRTRYFFNTIHFSNIQYVLLFLVGLKVIKAFYRTSHRKILQIIFGYLYLAIFYLILINFDLKNPDSVNFDLKDPNTINFDLKDLPNLVHFDQTDPNPARLTSRILI